MKYLIMEDFAGNAIPFIFPRRVNHADMRDQLPYSKVISAGYLELDNGKFITSGSAMELDAKMNSNDIDILIEALRHR